MLNPRALLRCQVHIAGLTRRGTTRLSLTLLRSRALTLLRRGLALLARSLIQEVGRLETVGRPVVFGTTFEFLQYFGLESLERLPALPETLIAMAEARSASSAEPPPPSP